MGLPRYFAKVTALNDQEPTLLPLHPRARSLLGSAYFKALRPHHYIKNLLLFAPALAEQQIGDLSLILTLALACLAFSLCASAVYIRNDIADVAGDSCHPTKRLRPFASGELTPLQGRFLSRVMLGVSFLLAFPVGVKFVSALLAYYLLAQTYSYYVKYHAYWDCLLLSVLYTLRIVGGYYAASLTLSPHLLIFSLFFFMSLALVKRYTQLTIYPDTFATRIYGKHAQANALFILRVSQIAGYTSLVFWFAFLQRVKGIELNEAPLLFWGAIFIVAGWLHWLWRSATKHRIGEDLVAFTLRDRASLVLGCLLLTIFLYAAHR